VFSRSSMIVRSRSISSLKARLVSGGGGGGSGVSPSGDSSPGSIRCSPGGGTDGGGGFGQT